MRQAELYLVDHKMQVRFGYLPAILIRGSIESHVISRPKMRKFVGGKESILRFVVAVD